MTAMTGTTTTLLTGKVALVHGAAGGLGSGIARAFAREGAHVVLTGRTAGPLAALAAEILATGGSAQADVVDALDEAAVDAHLAEVVAAHGRVDVALNLVTRGDVQGTPLVDMSVADLLRAPTTGLRSNFLTARAAARQMTRQERGGVILHLNSASGIGAFAGMGSTGPADAAIEAFYRYLAAET